jgi:tRNA (mo5U34)-methyltransferase
MKYQDLKESAEKIQWWHSIPLISEEGNTYVTNGIVNHCSEEIATKRFGMPESLEGKTVLDIGCWDGYFSFLAEKRNAKSVLGVDMLQGCSHQEQGTQGFEFAKKALNSKVGFEKKSLEEFAQSTDKQFDVVFYYGVLYHVENPINELKHLSKVTKEYTLIETAISQKNEMQRPFWEFLNGFDNDPTNFWYPNLLGLASALIYAGFESMEVIYNDGIRATVKATKKPL